MKNKWNLFLEILPIVIILRPTEFGGLGGASLTIKGSGVDGLGGCWRIMSGGAGGVNKLGVFVMT